MSVVAIVLAIIALVSSVAAIVLSIYSWATTEKKVGEMQNVSIEFISSNSLIPMNLTYYFYNGSTTTLNISSPGNGSVIFWIINFTKDTVTLNLSTGVTWGVTVANYNTIPSSTYGAYYFSEPNILNCYFVG
jgi:hypothetical protein